MGAHRDPRAAAKLGEGEDVHREHWKDARHQVQGEQSDQRQSEHPKERSPGGGLRLPRRGSGRLGPHREGLPHRSAVGLLRDRQHPLDGAFSRLWESATRISPRPATISRILASPIRRMIFSITNGRNTSKFTRSKQARGCAAPLRCAYADEMPTRWRNRGTPSGPSGVVCFEMPATSNFHGPVEERALLWRSATRMGWPRSTISARREIWSCGPQNSACRSLENWRVRRMIIVCGAQGRANREIGGIGRAGADQLTCAKAGVLADVPSRPYPTFPLDSQRRSPGYSSPTLVPPIEGERRAQPARGSHTMSNQRGKC